MTPLTRFLTMKLKTVRGSMALIMRNMRLSGGVLTHSLIVMAFHWVELHILALAV
jgi:hypothetical protein